MTDRMIGFRRIPGLTLREAADNCWQVRAIIALCAMLTGALLALVTNY